MVDQDACMDIDMVNCHPVILSQVAQLLDVSSPVLANYVANRDSLLLELENKYGLTGAKDVALAIINGGIRSKLYPAVAWLAQFEAEIVNIYAALSETKIGKIIDAHIKKVNKSKNGQLMHKDGRRMTLFGTTINLLLCKIENEILTQAVFFFQARGIEVHTLCFDGLIVSKHDIVVQELEEYVRANLGLTMKFAVKSFKHPVSDRIIDYLNTIVPEADEARKEIDFTKPGITAIQACMGYGKTTQLIEHIRRDATSSVLTITPRCSLGLEFSDKFGPLGFAHYQSAGAFEEKRLICQMDSINKIRDKYDIVILDEIETNFNHVVSFDGMSQKGTILHALKVLIEHSKQTFIMDGNLSEGTKAIFKKEWPDKQFTDLKYKYKPFKDMSCNFVVGDRQIQRRHCDYVIERLTQGLKLACPVYSLDYLKDLNKSVAGALPDCKILLISSEMNLRRWRSLLISTWSSTRPRCCAATISTRRHFDLVVPCISNVHSSAKLYSQQILRVRQFDQLDFYFNLFLKQTIEIENAASLLVKDLYDILSAHGFSISGADVLLPTKQSSLLRYSKSEEYVKIIESATMTSKMLDDHSYSSHEYSKYMIEKTFDVAA
ncbi:unnamed protein product [Sphagnum jensenii]